MSTSEAGRARSKISAPTNYSAQIAEEIRDGILTGTFQPGERLSIRSLAASFGISHIPIREAVRTLEAEGLVEAAGNKRYTVAKIEAVDLRSLYELRELIEPALAEKAAPLMTDADLKDVERTLAELEATLPATAKFRENHRRFHASLLAPCRNPWVDRILDSLWRGSERYVGLFVEHLARSGRMGEHRLMAAAAIDRDGKRAAELYLQHLSTVEREIEDGLGTLRKSSEDSAS